MSHKAGASEGMDPREVLPAITIRDPYRWFSSMCRHRYAAHWTRFFIDPQNDQKKFKYHCPQFIPNAAETNRIRKLHISTIVEEHNDNPQQQSTLEEHFFPVKVKYAKFNRTHKSLVHLWSDWYREYLEEYNNALVMVRYEDLLFYPDLVIPQICHCAGGEMEQWGHTARGTPRIKVAQQSAKEKYAKKGEEVTGYIEALIRYGTADGRAQKMSPEDLEYSQRHLDKDLMDLFQYPYPGGG